jgi:hypothetical protein
LPELIYVTVSLPPAVMPKNAWHCPDWLVIS